MSAVGGEADIAQTARLSPIQTLGVTCESGVGSAPGQAPCLPESCPKSRDIPKSPLPSNWQPGAIGQHNLSLKNWRRIMRAIFTQEPQAHHPEDTMLTRRRMLSQSALQLVQPPWFGLALRSPPLLPRSKLASISMFREAAAIAMFIFSILRGFPICHSAPTHRLPPPSRIYETCYANSVLTVSSSCNLPECMAQTMLAFLMPFANLGRTPALLRSSTRRRLGTCWRKWLQQDSAACGLPLT